MTDSEVQDLIRLVIRRPDSEDLFHWVGRELSLGFDGTMRLGWVSPRSIKLRLARRRVARGLASLFGRAMVKAAEDGIVALESRDDFLMEADPGGDACHIVTGFAAGVLTGVLAHPVEARHFLCRSRGHEICRWDGGPAPGIGGRAAEQRSTLADRDIRRPGPEPAGPEETRT